MGSLSIYIVKIACERELVSFMLVCLVVRWVPPRYSSRIICSVVVTHYFITPYTLTKPVSLSSLMAMESFLYNLQTT
jgi:hypothetical protein